VEVVESGGALRRCFDSGSWLMYCNIQFLVLLDRHQKENVLVAFSGKCRNIICLLLYVFAQGHSRLSYVCKMEYAAFAMSFARLTLSIPN
jgi:hypothetical protein